MKAPSLQLASREGAKKSNLAFALACLPSDRRSDALLFYDFCRTVDDIADDPVRPPSEKRVLLDQWKTASPNELPSAFAGMVARRALDPALLREIILGVEMDIEPRRYETRAELRGYCWRVACAVGLVSIDIFGCRDPGSKTYAEFLGQALQLTNILRDVGEDASLGRIYLPLEDLRRFSVSEKSLLAGKPDGNFFGLMSFEADRAREDFLGARQSLPAGDRRALGSARIMQISYEKILARMTAGGFRVFERRYRLSRWEKFCLLARAFWGGWMS
jgi:15-cis-phytoene synthase